MSTRMRQAGLLVCIGVLSCLCGCSRTTTLPARGPLDEWAGKRAEWLRKMVESEGLPESYAYRNFAKSTGVTIAPAARTISPTPLVYIEQVTVEPEGRLAEREREKNILVLPITITNSSDRAVAAHLAHEWHGGLWPPTDLYALVKPANPLWAHPVNPVDLIHPVFLAGESSAKTEPTTIPPGESRTVKLRMDWSGTGSCPARPLMDPKASDSYEVQLLVIFKQDGDTRYAVSDKFAVQTIIDEGSERSEAAEGQNDEESVVLVQAWVPVTVIRWSEMTRNEEYGLEYRAGVVRTDPGVDPHTHPLLVEFRNVGDVARNLRAYGRETLVYEVYVDGQYAGRGPLVGLADPGDIELWPGGGPCHRIIYPCFRPPGEAGQKDVSIGFWVRNPEAPDDFVELRTAPVSVLFKMKDDREAER